MVAGHAAAQIQAHAQGAQGQSLACGRGAKGHQRHLARPGIALKGQLVGHRLRRIGQG